MTRILAAAITALLLALPAFSQAPAPSAAKPGPDDRARQWLVLLDDSNFADSAAQMGPQARKADIAALAGLRQPLGAMSSRTLKDVKLSASVPGMPSGQYAVVRFDSSFAHRANMMETITLILNKGAWSVVRYQVE